MDSRQSNVLFIPYGMSADLPALRRRSEGDEHDPRDEQEEGEDPQRRRLLAQDRERDEGRDDRGAAADRGYEGGVADGQGDRGGDDAHHHQEEAARPDRVRRARGVRGREALAPPGVVRDAREEVREAVEQEELPRAEPGGVDRDLRQDA